MTILNYFLAIIYSFEYVMSRTMNLKTALFCVDILSETLKISMCVCVCVCVCARARAFNW